ncbi:hypothetical protein M3Y98_01200200 [Aphelenchoides besseyi]|nr:hypothetical protein M3Y98_01200200 [Aphelenchoides besseyi]
MRIIQKETCTIVGSSMLTDILTFRTFLNFFCETVQEFLHNYNVFITAKPEGSSAVNTVDTRKQSSASGCGANDDRGFQTRRRGSDESKLRLSDQNRKTIEQAILPYFMI